MPLEIAVLLTALAVGNASCTNPAPESPERSPANQASQTALPPSSGQPPPGERPDGSTHGDDPSGFREPSRGTPGDGGPLVAGSAVVTYDGVRELRFGDTERDLTDRGVVIRDAPDCGPQVVASTGIGPVFIDGRLALVWADPPLHTPEGISVGDSLAATRAAYPGATELTAPRGSHRFDGLLAAHGDRAYLFLHDGRTVQKLIAGYERHARALFRQGFAGC